MITPSLIKSAKQRVHEPNFDKPIHEINFKEIGTTKTVTKFSKLCQKQPFTK